MYFSFSLLGDAIVSGLLLGGFYAGVTIGVSISFGMLDIVNIAHPAFIILGSYCAYVANSVLRGRSDRGEPRAVAGCSTCSAPASIRSITSPSSGAATVGLRGLAFFFGLLFITEVLLVLVFGVDYRLVQAPSISVPACISARSSCRCGCWSRASCRWR